MDKEIEILKLKIQLLEKEIELLKLQQAKKQELTQGWRTQVIPCNQTIDPSYLNVNMVS